MPVVRAGRAGSAARVREGVCHREGQPSGIAKFPRKDDEIKTVVWETVALALAKKLPS